jgi:hypothetical protein
MNNVREQNQHGHRDEDGLYAFAFAQDALAIPKGDVEIVLALDEEAQFLFAAFVAEEKYENHVALGVDVLKGARLAARMEFEGEAVRDFDLGVIVGEQSAARLLHSNFAYFNHVGVLAATDAVKDVMN